MRERCLQSLAILLAGLFSAERARTQAERGLDSGVTPRERDVAPPKAPQLQN